jgi:hypothetical protein
VAGLVELLALQGFDISIDQANHRLTHLPEIDERRRCMEVMATLEARQREIEAAIAATEDVITKGERTTRDIDDKVKRLESQLRTVIAPREAEALQHEIATLRHEREESDEHGIEALEENERLSRELTENASTLATARVNLTVAIEELRAAQQLVHDEIDRLAAQRVEQARLIDEGLLARYEKQRQGSTRVLVAALNGSTCGGCHLDLSQAERDELRRLPEGETPECPHCGCLLVA